jgi:YcaO-like protein with predicted kinase domain
LFETIHRPYKERNASETVSFAKQILYSLDLLPVESFRASPYPGLYSVCLELPAEKGEFRANGKGRTIDFSLASGYAEFLERIQNGLFATFPRTFITNFKQRFGYYYTPDESYLTPKDFQELPADLVNDIVRYSGAGQFEFMAKYYERARNNGAPGVVAVPFFDTQSGHVINLPLNLLLLTVGSNGMAAGNTQAEALYQALCELLERWGAAEVFYRQLTPPSIPPEFLAQFSNEMAIIQAIEAGGKYRVTIKDFSAGRRIPALGILVEIPEENKYRLNVGCDTCFQVALSRCLTEIYQGISNEDMFDEAALPKQSEEYQYFVDNDEIALHQRYMAFSQFTVDNRGPFPLSLFDSEPSYRFDSDVWFQRSSHIEEVQRLVSFFHEQEYNVYLRDVSFLGFPAVFCYVPEVSALGRKNVPFSTYEQAPIMFELDRIESKALKLKSCSNSELEEIAEVLGKLSGGITFTNVFGIEMKQTSIWREYPVALLLSQIWYRLGDLEKSNESFKVFMELREGDENPYYDLVACYLARLADGMSKEEAAQNLTDNPAYVDLACTVIEDLADSDEIFRFVKLPNCPDCDQCDLQDDCVMTGRLNVMSGLYAAMLSHKVNQEGLAWVNQG